MKESEIWVRLFQVTDLIRELHDRECVEDRPPLRSTLAEMKIMGCVIATPGGCSVKELSERMKITPGAVSQIVEKLVRRGPLVRLPDETDRRSVRIMLSPAGLERHERLNAEFGKILSEMLTGVPEEKVAIFVEVLDHLIAAKNRLT